jgi:Excreted virulence factor EspC, type VII ESX diderm
MVDMGRTLRVDPSQLRSAAAAQGVVANTLSRTAIGQSLATAGTSMSGLSTEAACQFVETALDAAAGAVHDELTVHSSNLSQAADRYHTADDELGRRLRAFSI